MNPRPLVRKMPMRRNLLIAAVTAALLGLVAAAPGAADTTTPLMLVTTAQQAAAAATSVHLKATIGSDHERLDLMLVKDRGAVGSLSRSGYRIKLIRIGATIYLKASQRFYVRFVGGHAARLLRGKWLAGRATSTDFKRFAPLLDMTMLLTQALSIDPTAALTLGPNATVAGQPVTQVVDDAGGTLSIAATGTPFPVRLVSGVGGQSFTFTRWNGPVHLKAPVHVIDLS
jgi:hypothetical protein